MRKISNIPKALIDDLEALFPPRDMTHHDTEAYHRYYGGCRQVVKFLREHYNKQQNQFSKEDM